MTVTTDPRKTGVNAGPSLLAASSVAIPLTGTVVETVMATVSVPGGAMGANGGLEIRTVWTYPNSVNNKVLRVRFGGIGGTQYLASTVSTTVVYSDVRRIRNRNSASSQVGSYAVGSFSVGASTSAPPTGALDTSTSQDLVLTGQLASAAETITLESYEVWLLP